jgi:hypothetical protein
MPALGPSRPGGNARTRMRRSRARFSGPVSLVHAPSLADSIANTPEFRFSVHSGKLIVKLLARRTDRQLLRKSAPPGGI